MKYYVYIIFSNGHNKYYIGQTQNIEVRLARHNHAFEKATSPYIPWEVVCIIEKDSRSQALILEKKLKNLNRVKLVSFINKYK
ncbi:MAG: GIY-YIG nuclease family protein [Chitinophagaceae bacterium]|nr:GIY-YIG nuclease family protein [Chitinophagaceae bacterium]